MKLDILTYPHPILKTKSESVKSVNDEVRKFIQDMFETMYAEGGIGLAANQVGVMQRILVLHITPERDEEITKEVKCVMINPEIMEAKGEAQYPEGCLSCPGLILEVPRAAKVTVQFLDEHGEARELKANGLLAVAIQHEIDHLDGVTLVDRLSPLKRSLYKRKLAKGKAFTMEASLL